jgi:hypothetical protein
MTGAQSQFVMTHCDQHTRSTAEHSLQFNSHSPLPACLSPADLSSCNLQNSAENDTMWSNFTQLTELRLSGGGPLPAGLAALQPQIKILRLGFAAIGAAY